MKALLLLVFLTSGASLSADSFYELQIRDAQGSEIDLTAFKGKRVLVVNIASSSDQANQLHALQQLYQQHSDSLIILGVPSNNFGNEPLADSVVVGHLQQQYGITFIITERMSVAGPSQHSLYQWLTMETKNGAASSTVYGDFQKYLVGKNGELVGVFGSSVLPGSQEFLKSFNY